MLMTLLIVTLVLYLASAWMFLRQVAQTPEALVASGFVKRFGLPLLAVIAHGALVFVQLERDHFDHLNMASSLSIVAWLLAALTLLRGKSAGMLLRPVIYLFAAFTVVLMILAPVDWGATLSPQRGLVIHIVLSLLAYGVLLLATLYAIQLLYLTKILKQRRAGVLSHYLPPLMSVEHYFFRLVSAGTILLAVAILTGFVFLDNMFAQGQAHKTILSLIALAIYSVIVILHKVRGVRGRIIVISTVVASAILTLGYFGSRFVKDVLLSA